MTFVPCSSSFPDSVKICDVKNITYTAIPSTDKLGKESLTVAITIAEPKSDAYKKLTEDTNAVSANSWVTWADDEISKGETISFSMKNSVIKSEAEKYGLWKCASSLKEI